MKMVGSQEDLLKLVSSALEKAKLSYMLTGAYAVVFYGRPRASHDIDFVVDVDNKSVPKIIKMFKSLPFDFMLDEEMIRAEIKRRGMFNVYYHAGAVKLDFWILKDTEFEKARFGRRKRERILGQDMVVSTPEDTILQKLVWYDRSKIEKHLIDAAFVWQIQEPELDKQYINRWVKKLRIQKYLKRLTKVDLEEHY